MTALRPAQPGSAEQSYRASFVTHAGSVRRLNSDSVIVRSETGLWAVADAMGGDNTPGIGSAAIARSLARIAPFDSQYAGRRAVRGALNDVNERLHLRAKEERLGNVGASAVVLLIRDGQYACMWAGNCRAYLFRASVLRQITNDHCLDERQLSADGDQPVLTRSIGSYPTLSIDAMGGELLAGDRFLLCSDGALAVEPSQLEQTVSASNVSKALNNFVEQALSAGAKDNVTVVVVET